MSSDDTLDDLRKQIDALDDELLRTLAKRMKVVAAVGEYKKANGLELRDDRRLQAIITAQLAKTESLNLSEEFVTELYQLIHTYALAIEAEA